MYYTINNSLHYLLLISMNCQYYLRWNIILFKRVKYLKNYYCITINLSHFIFKNLFGHLLIIIILSIRIDNHLFSCFRKIIIKAYLIA